MRMPMKNANRIQKDWLDAITQELLAKGELKWLRELDEYTRNSKNDMCLFRHKQRRNVKHFKKA